MSPSDFIAFARIFDQLAVFSGGKGAVSCYKVRFKSENKCFIIHENLSDFLEWS